MNQIVDLEREDRLKALDVELVSIAIDPLSQLAEEVDRLRIGPRFLSDEDRQVSKAYGLPLTHGNDEPGHIFVLVGKDGVVKWVKDYGAPENGGLMYVATAELYNEVSKSL